MLVIQNHFVWKKKHTLSVIEFFISKDLRKCSQTSGPFCIKASYFSVIGSEFYWYWYEKVHVHLKFKPIFYKKHHICSVIGSEFPWYGSEKVRLKFIPNLYKKHHIFFCNWVWVLMIWIWENAAKIQAHILQKASYFFL